MSKIIYLMCSLPSLTYGSEPPVTLEGFQEEAELQLSAKDFEILKLADLRKMNPEIDNSVLSAFVEMLKELTYDYTEFRRAKSQGQKPDLAYLPFRIVDMNPLEREIELIRWQWEYLEEIEFGNTFTIIEVLVYKLKLQLLWRLKSFNHEQGMTVFDRMLTL